MDKSQINRGVSDVMDAIMTHDTVMPLMVAQLAVQILAGVASRTPDFQAEVKNAVSAAAYVIDELLKVKEAMNDD